jgi:hypothetical protein
MLHIHSGDCSFESVRAEGVAGRHLPWREALINGPVRVSAAELVSVRGPYLAAAFGADPASYRRDFMNVHEALLGADGEGVVFWFDEDLFCQINLWFLLSEWNGSGPLSMQSREKGLRRIDERELRAAKAAWRAYSADDPREIEREIASGSPLSSPLLLHLSRFPSVENGLGAIDSAILRLVSDGHADFRSVFAAFSEEHPEFGYGDADFWLDIQRLAGGKHPLLQVSGGMRDASLQLTGDGRGVHDNSRDQVDLNGIDLWLGGVHLSGSTAQWRWNGHVLVG